MKLSNLQVSVINSFLNLLVLEIANNYLNNLKNFKENEVDEMVLKFLDNSVFLAAEKIDITDEDLNNRIKKMTSSKQEQFQKVLAKQNSYSDLCQKLNYIYVVVKEEDKQLELFKKLYSLYDKDESLFAYQETDVYKGIEPYLLHKHNNIYCGKINKI